MAVTNSVVQVGSATRAGDGSTVFSGGPWTVRLWLGEDCGRRYIRRLRVDVRDPRVRVTGTRLARLPLGHLLHTAATEAATAEHPNDALYRLLATPKPAGQRHWDPGHYDRVLEVYRWARRTKRPGGGRRAVAEFWRVAVNPTVNRWLAIARAQQRARPDDSA